MREVKCEHDWFDCSNERVLPPAKSCRKCGWTVGEDEERGMFVQWPWLPALSSDAVQPKAERSEPVASVAEVRADGQRLYNTVYPSDALDKFPIGTLLYTSPPTSELETLRKRVAELEKAMEPFAEIAGEAWADGSGWTNAACQNDRICDWFGPSAFHTARRVREGGKVDG